MCMLYLFANADRFNLPTCCKGMIRGLEHEHVISAVQTEFASCKPNSNENWLCLDRISTNSTPCQTRFTKCNMYRRCPTAAAWLVMCRLGYSNFTCSIRTARKYEMDRPLVGRISLLGGPGWPPVCSQSTNTRACWFGQGLWTFVQPISGICFCSWQSTSWLIQSCRCAQWRSCEMRSSYYTLFPILNTLPLLPSISQQK